MKCFLTTLVALLALAPAVALAAPAKGPCTTANGQTTCTLDNPLQTDSTSPASIIGLVIKTALGIIGALTLFMLIWGGFTWMTAAGNPERVKTGSKTMIWAVIGVLVVFASYMYLNNLMQFLFGKTK